MRLRYRITILIVLMTTFFVVSPILILWTLGYRYNPKKITIEKTGLLVVETDPKEARIYLDDEEQKKQTPAKIKYLLPDIYGLQIKKEGFVAYEKKITIESGLTTFIDDLALFKQSLPVLMTSDDIEELVIVSDNNKLSFIYGEDKKKKLDKENLDFVLPQDYKHYILDAVNSYFIFKNPSNNKLLVFDANKQIIFDNYGKEIVFNKNEDEFIVYDDFEINLYNVSEKRKNFINRSSKQIKNVFFLEDNFIICALEDGIYAIEKYAENAERATLVLSKFENIQTVILDDKKENLYILGKIGDKQGIYKLTFR